jgi:hypothetical protein
VKLLQYVALILLAGVFLHRFSAIAIAGEMRVKLRDREFLLPWLACGLGALAMLTQGGVWSQSELDAPLGGTNILKLIQDILTVTAFLLGAWTALDLDGPQDARVRPRRWLLFAGLIAALAVTFFLTPDRGRTNYYYVEQNQTRPTVWIFAVTYILELAVVTGILFVGVWRRPARPYWLFRIGGILVLTACLLEFIDLLAGIVPGLGGIRGMGRSLFDPIFYPGIALIVAALVVFAAIRWLRDHRIRRYVARLRALCEAHNLPSAVGADTFSMLAQFTVTVRDSYVAGTVPLKPADVALLNEAEDFIERELSHLIDLDDTAPIITIEPSRMP